MAKPRRKRLSLVEFPAPKQEPKWTPESMLTEFLGDIRSGKIKPDCCLVFWVEPNADGRLIPHYWTQNVSVQTQIAYGELLKRMAFDDWTK